MLIRRLKINAIARDLLILAVMLFSGYLWSQELPPVRNFSPSTYKADNQNWAITQSSDRKIYFANNQGLLEYNGAQWHNYPTPNESIMRSVCWHAGRLYTGAYMDFGYWQTKTNGTLTYTSLVEKLKVPIREDEQFWQILSTESLVLIRSLNRIYSYNPQDNKVQLVVEMDGLTQVFSLANRIFYNVSNKGLFEIDNGKSLLIADRLTLDGDVIAMQSNGSTIKFVTSLNSLYQLADRSTQQISENKFPSTLTVYSAETLPDGGFALGTISNGLLITDATGNIKYHLNQENGLYNNTVLSLLRDQDDNLWLGLDNGIDFIDLKSPYKSFIDRTGKLGTVYDAIKYNGSLYLGTNQGLYIKRQASDTFEYIAGTKGQVWILKEIDGTLFCGHNLGTFIIDGDRAINVSTTEGTWDIKKIKNEPNLLLQGNYNGLNILERQGDTWKFRNKIADFNISSKDFAMREGKIYVGHEYKGLFELEITPDYTSVSNYKLIKNVGKGINSDVIELGKELVYTNKSGFYITNTKSGEFERNATLSSLFAESEYTSGRLVKTSEKQFWVFTKNQLYQVTKEPIGSSYEVKSYLLPQSKRVEKNGYESLVEISNGFYLLGTAKGYMLFDAQLEQEPDRNVAIAQISITTKDSINKLVDLDKDIEILSGPHKIQIKIFTTNFSPFTDIKYQYRMSGFQEEWSSPSARDILIFENLEYGNYTFTVRQVVNGVVGSNTSTATFKIEAPFYWSNIDIILYMFDIGSFILFVNFYFRSYYKRKKNQEIIREQKQLQLELLQSEKSVSELRNQKLSDDIESRNRELAITTMAMIKKNETLSNISAELDKLNQKDNADLKSVKSLIEISMNSRTGKRSNRHSLWPIKPLFKT